MTSTPLFAILFKDHPGTHEGNGPLSAFPLPRSYCSRCHEKLGVTISLRLSVNKSRCSLLNSSGFRTLVLLESEGDLVSAQSA
jgi:hypothetical protein